MKHPIWSNPEQPPAFDVDGMLGGLAKWLRILGYDTAFPRSRPTSPLRIFVTTAVRKAQAGAVIVTATKPLQQLGEVLQQTEIEPDDALFFSRCILCNEPVSPIAVEQAHGKVPEYIFRSVTEFTGCPKCGRIYWEGSHLGRVKRRLKEIAAGDE